MTLALAGEQTIFFVRGAKTFALGSMSYLFMIYVSSHHTGHTGAMGNMIILPLWSRTEKNPAKIAIYVITDSLSLKLGSEGASKRVWQANKPTDKQLAQYFRRDS